MVEGEQVRREDKDGPSDDGSGGNEVWKPREERIGAKR